MTVGLIIAGIALALFYGIYVSLVKKKNNLKEEVVILTATSGDTGKAALEGFKDVDKIKIVVFFPENGVSNIQKLQIKTPGVFICSF